MKSGHTWGKTRVDVYVSVAALVEMFVSAVALYVCEQTMLDNTIVVLMEVINNTTECH